MLRKVILWWKIRPAESDLRFLRRLLRDHPDDPKLKELLPLVEQEYHALRVEQMCRWQGWHWSFVCKCCGEKNAGYTKPVACVHCGLDAPADLKMTVPRWEGTNGQHPEETKP